jgi:hypothetical protein
MADKTDEKIACGHTWKHEYEGVWHVNHTCKIKIVPGVPHTGFHLCSCGRVD